MAVKEAMSKKPKKSDQPGTKYSPTIYNKKARFNFHLLEKLEAGIALLGTEVKSLRQGRASLEEAYCRLRGGELYLVGCNIGLYEHGNMLNHEPLRARKLLVHGRELKRIEVKMSQKGLTIVPIRIYFSEGWAKVEIALAEGKTHGDKRDKIRDRQVTREIDREMKRRR